MADITRPHVATVVWEGGYKYVVYVRQNESIRFRVDYDCATGHIVFAKNVDGKFYKFEPERGIFKLLLEAVTRWVAESTTQTFQRQQRFVTRSEFRSRWNERGEHPEEHEPTRGEEQQ